MKIIRSRSLAALVFFAAASLFSGCLFGPDDKETPDAPPDVVYKPLTDKNNVIDNLVTSYNDANIDEYTKLIHDDYIWCNQLEDVVMHGAEEFVLRDEDLARTGNMFAARKGTHPDAQLHLAKLQLELYPGSWTQITEIGGVPCADCWTTTREYYLTLVTKSGDMTYNASDLVKLWVVSVMEGDTKLYKLRRVDDISK